MADNLERVMLKAERTRRHALKMGAIAGSAVIATLASTRGGAANPVSSVLGSKSVHCILRGTTILTADGGRRIEDLAIGDLLPTMFGGLRPVQWIARYPFRKLDPSKAWPRAFRPIRVARSAIAPGVPHSDLYLSPEHAILIDGLLVPVKNLIDGVMIVETDPRDRDELEYFNIKFEGHDVITAEGAPIETTRHVDEAAVNFAEYYRMYGMPEADDALCAPWASYAGVRGQLASRARSALAPWIDMRQPIDVIRDRFEERALAISKQPEVAGQRESEPA